MLCVITFKHHLLLLFFSCNLKDQTIDEDDAPAAAYSRFKKLFLKLTEASSKLPQLPLNQFSDEEDDLDESLTYEDLLAIAIINEVGIGL